MAAPSIEQPPTGRRNPLKEALRQGRGVFGCFNNFASPCVAELTGLAGYDLVLIDGEHGPGSHAEHRAMVQAAAAAGTAAVFRVPGADPIHLKRAADLGVQGILVPAVETAEEARLAVAACRYGPAGTRSCAAPLLRASGYGTRTGDYVEGLDRGEELLFAVLIETASGVENADAIAAVDGVDVVFAGPNDLAATLGVPGQLDHPLVLAGIARIEEAARRHGRFLGGLPYASIDLTTLWRRGYRFLVPGSDVILLRDAMLAQLRQARALRN